MKAILFSGLLLAGCSLNDVGNFKMRDTHKYFPGSETNRYFLPNLPDWINFSQTASCKRKVSIRYLDISKLQRSFSLSYNQGIQFQYLFNKKLEEIKLKQDIKFIPFETKEKIFYDVSNKIQSGITAFRRPSFEQIHLVWIDPLLSRPAELRELLDQSFMVDGHPVFISLCKSFLEMEKFLQKNHLSNQNIRIMPLEMFSVFNSEGMMTTAFHLDIPSFFSKKQRLRLFVPGYTRPSELVGQIKITYLKSYKQK